uniref:hypothetical protein n=1 Tax=Ningiella ruwaisensis TaxID=2364274 RepID=UPI0010A043E2|nr:hypothetical protein [Ningiella ruwaisensis]
MSIDYSVSEVVKEYATTVTNLLPRGYNEAELEAAMKLAFTALNAVTVGKWNQIMSKSSWYYPPFHSSGQHY